MIKDDKSIVKTHLLRKKGISFRNIAKILGKDVKTIHRWSTYEMPQSPNKKDVVRAHYTVSNHINNGRLKRKPCEKCGALKTDAHHPDYTKPLKVRWLCRKHHKESHKAIK